MSAHPLPWRVGGHFRGCIYDAENDLVCDFEDPETAARKALRAIYSGMIVGSDELTLDAELADEIKALANEPP